MKLKTCPFCKMGELQFVEIPVIVVHPPGGQRTRRTDHAIACNSCDAMGPPAIEKEMAASLWNLRASTTK